MAQPIRTDLCVIGAGSGGLAVAAGAVQMGARVVLIEQGKMGGDCLNYGCVPSKSLRPAVPRTPSAPPSASASTATSPRSTTLACTTTSVIAAIAPHDSQERFEKLGVEVIRAHARFVGPQEVEADGRRIRARRIVVATGSSPALPPIAGSRRHTAPDQRDGVRPDRAAGAPGRDRRRPDRLRAGSGIPPPGRARDHPRAALDPAQGRPRRGSGGA